MEREFLAVKNLTVEVRRRAFQRSLGIKILPSGEVRVTSGRGVPREFLQKFVLERIDWIEKHLQRFAQERAKYPPKKFLNGETFLFRGEEFRLKLAVGEVKEPRLDLQGAELVMLLPLIVAAMTPVELRLYQREVLRPSLRRFYKRHGREILRESVKFHSEKMQLFPQKLSFRSQRTLWGSCTSAGHVSLNWRLVAAPPAVLDYVVIHELAHLRYQNHSDEFWTLVEQYCPEFMTHRKWLREHRQALDFLAL